LIKKWKGYHERLNNEAILEKQENFKKLLAFLKEIIIIRGYVLELSLTEGRIHVEKRFKFK